MLDAVVRVDGRVVVAVAAALQVPRQHLVPHLHPVSWLVGILSHC
jgi:hypothetical protein